MRYPYSELTCFDMFWSSRGAASIIKITVLNDRAIRSLSIVRGPFWTRVGSFMVLQVL